nr:hypothetical protein [Tanacetum cinerariifolium]
MTPRYKNDDHSGQFRNQRTVNVAGAREKVGSPIVQQSGIQCFNCKEYGHFAKECRKSKRVKDFAYHKEKMLLSKELEAHYSYMAKIQEVPTADSGTDSKPLEQVQNDVGYNVFANDLQHFKQSESVSNTCLVETNDSNVIPNSPDMLRFVIDCDFSWIAFGLRSLVFYFQRSCVLPWKHCVLSSKILRFASVALRFVYLKDLAFCLGSTAFYVLQRSLRFVLETLHFVYFKDLAFCLGSSAFCLLQKVAVTDDSPTILEHTTVETPMNMSPENKARFHAEKEAIHLILIGIGDEIYSTVDACQTAQEMWEAIKRHKGKEIAKPITPPSEIVFEEDNDPEQAQRDKDMQKNLALIAKTINVAGARENVGSPIVQQSGIQCFNCNEFGHLAKECIKPKTVKDSAYHKGSMLPCKQAKQGVSLQAEQYDWLAGTDEEIDEHELEAHYSYMEKIQEVPTADTGIDSDPLEQIQNEAGYNVFANDLQHSEQSESVSNTCLVETDDSNVIPDSPDMCEDAIQNDQNDVESDDERVALANLIANLKLDVDENKKIQKLLRKQTQHLLMN